MKSLPVYAFLEYQNINCPSCNSPLTCGYEPGPCYITFQWGYCAARTAGGSAYHVGEEIQWRQCRDGIIRAWTCFDGGYRFNVGDPAIVSVIVTDVGTDTAHFPQLCRFCGNPIGGAALHIKHNKITSAWAFLPGQLRSGLPAVYYDTNRGGDGIVEIAPMEAEPWQVVNCYVEQDDGTWKPMPEWEFRVCDYFDS